MIGILEAVKDRVTTATIYSHCTITIQLLHRLPFCDFRNYGLHLLEYPRTLSRHWPTDLRTQFESESFLYSLARIATFESRAFSAPDLFTLTAH